MLLTKTNLIIFMVVFVLMTLDFVSGIVAAFAEGTWKSKIMRQGLLHKCSLLLCVVLGAVLKIAQNYLALGIEVPIYEAICAYIALMEAGSVIENVCKANPSLMPEKLRSVFGLPEQEDKRDER